MSSPEFKSQKILRRTEVQITVHVPVKTQGKESNNSIFNSVVSNTAVNTCLKQPLWRLPKDGAEPWSQITCRKATCH